MKPQTLFPTLLVALIMLPHQALGKLITIEPDDFDHGTDISYLNEEVSLSSFSVNQGGPFEHGPVYSITAESCVPEHPLECDSDYVAPTGSKVFGFKDSIDRFSPGWGNVSQYEIYVEYGWYPSYLQALKASFLRDTNYVSIKAITTRGSSDPNVLLGFNRAWELIAVSRSFLGDAEEICCDSEGMGPYWSYENSISRPQNDIAYVVVGGASATNRLDHLTFNVSEPRVAPIFLMALVSLLLIRVWRGRRSFWSEHSIFPTTTIKQGKFL